MNRLSFLFAALMAVTFAVQAPRAGEPATPEAQSKRLATRSTPQEAAQEPEALINTFTAKIGKNTANEAEKGFPNITILFATVPHPLETRLGAQFDHNIDALQDGIQDAGYLFDSALIPWTEHPSRESFEDDEKEKKAKSAEDTQPGILLFRKEGANTDAYGYGLAVFLITEKPTEGIAYSQVETALDIIKSAQLTLWEPVRIVGPTFSGSFASLVPVVQLIASRNPTVKQFKIRSGAVTVGDYAVTAAKALATTARVDFGSAKYDGKNATAAALEILSTLGIPDCQVAIFSESESAYGSETASLIRTPDPRRREATVYQRWQPWEVIFPRDISSLRTEYQKQGILDAYAQEEPWKRSLILKGEEAREGDSVRTFGGLATNAAQESVLLGISDFLRAHGIGAVIISASNEEDRYFLTQFFHAHNAGVRVVIIGATRLFMRGSTAQFRGDLMVDDFPMLPRLQDWTGGTDEKNRPAGARVRSFADESSEGTYFATLDVAALPTIEPKDAKENSKQYPWIPEYSEPMWDKDAKSTLRPAIYVVALGSNSAWPLTESSKYPWHVECSTDENRTTPSLCEATSPNSDSTVPAVARVEMPFTLFGRDTSHRVQPRPMPTPIRVATTWKILFCVLVSLAMVYCVAFWYADSVNRSTFASFAPLPSWRYAIFKCAVPGVLGSAAFYLMAWTVDLPKAVLADGRLWPLWSRALAILIPVAIAGSALLKAKMPGALAWQERIPLVLVSVGLAYCSACGLGVEPQTRASDASSILNTYREMHWESGLSLIPTGLLLLFALLIWSYQAGQGVALLECAPPLPTFKHDDEISHTRSEEIIRSGRPFPSAGGMEWMWLIWASATVLMAALLHWYHLFTGITSLEPQADTRRVLWVCFAVASLMLLDVLQFGWLWGRLKSLLIAVERQKFKRSFVPIKQFDWRAIWSFGGASFRDRRATETAQLECVITLAYEYRFASLVETANELKKLREKYSRVPLKIDAVQHRIDRQRYCELVAFAGTAAAKTLEKLDEIPELARNTGRRHPEHEVVDQCKEKEGRFSEERDEVAALPEWQKAAERLVCLLYIGLIETVVARLHSLLISVATMFSLAALAAAIYPFAPVAPLVETGLVLLALIAFAFFKVFSGMDTDPVLARIVNGDDRKLEWSFYGKFAESMALPLLTMASTLLPGGTSRLLDLARVLFSHGQ